VDYNKKQARKYLKLSFNGKTKRSTLFCDFDNFRAEAANIYNAKFDEEKFEFLYLDDEDDIIQIENQSDYDQALLFLFNSNYKTLKIRILPKYQYDEHNESNKSYSELPQLLIDSLYTRRLNELNDQLNESEYTYTTTNNPSRPMSCSRCLRSFSNDSYYKHIKVCWRVFQMKRTPFNSRRKRLTREQLLFSITHRDYNANREEWNNKQKKWKQQSEEFRRHIKELRERRNEDSDNSSERSNDNSKPENRNSRQHHRRPHHEKKRYPFDSRSQRLRDLGEVRVPGEFAKRQKKWKQLSQKFRAIIKLSKMLRQH